MSNTSTDKREAMVTELRTKQTRNMEQMAERPWLYTIMYAFGPVMLTFVLYLQWGMGYLNWHRLTTDRLTQFFVCVYCFATVVAAYSIFRVWAARNRMQAAKRQREWEAAHPIPTEGVWPPPPTQP